MSYKRLKIYALYSDSHEVLLNDFFLPSLRNTDVDVILKKIEQINSITFGSSEWSQIMLQKIDFVIAALRENLDYFFIVSDVDIQFFKKISEDLILRMKGKDILFQGEDYTGHINAGFYVCRGSVKVLKFWQEVRQRLYNSIESNQIQKFAEQYYINLILLEGKQGINYGILPSDEYFGLREVYTGKNVLKISDTIRMHHANWTKGMDMKIHNLRHVQDIVGQNKCISKNSFLFSYYYNYFTSVQFVASRCWFLFRRIYFLLKKMLFHKFW